MDDKKEKEKKPDDKSNLLVEASVKIFDPTTKEVILEKRA